MNYKIRIIDGNIKFPCSKCPYKLGIIHTYRNPCPECRTSGYKAYEMFVNQNERKVN